MATLIVACITAIFTIAMFILVLISVLYAKHTYKQNAESDKFNYTYQFYKDFKQDYASNFDSIVKIDKEEINERRTELWFKARGISEFFSYLGQSLKAEKVDLDNIFKFFYKYLFEYGTFTTFINNIKEICSRQEWKDSEKLLKVARDNFNYLMNEISKTSKDYENYFDLVKNNIPVHHIVIVSETVRITGNISVKVTSKKS
jgi:hypothetical protein